MRTFRAGKVDLVYRQIGQNLIGLCLRDDAIRNLARDLRFGCINDRLLEHGRVHILRGGNIRKGLATLQLGAQVSGL